jgi:FtsP/CotA-like multicopper oxidase with cupredoxin domain
LLDGRRLNVWAYDGQVPGPLLRVRLGEGIEVHLQNDLPQPTTIHWHGVRVPNAMDGVPGVTQDPVSPGQSFTYLQAQQASDLEPQQERPNVALVGRATSETERAMVFRRPESS